MNETKYQTRIFINDTRKIDVMKRKYTVLIEKDPEGLYVSEVPELPGCHTQAKSIDELIERTREAIKAYLDSDEQRETSNFVGIQQIEV